METTWTLLGLAGAVALLLWGVHMVQTGVQRAYGADLRRVLGTALNHRLAAFAAGLGVTAVLQSSTATGLMVTGFAAGGAVALVPALAVMLGANVGTTLIVQVLSFDVAAVSPALILIGVLLFRRAGAPGQLPNFRPPRAKPWPEMQRLLETAKPTVGTMTDAELLAEYYTFDAVDDGPTTEENRGRWDDVADECLKRGLV